MWRQWYDAYACTGRLGIPTSARSTLISGKGRPIKGNSKRIPMEVTLGVPGRPSTAHVAHRGDPLGVVMYNLGPDYEGDHRHKRHWPDGDTV